MKILTLTRERSTETETMGTLEFDGVTLHTVEQEWRPTAPGGEPNNSCVPCGTYELWYHTRPNGDKVVALVNPGHGVYYQKEDRPSGVGRFLILMHAGNSSDDVIGCVAPGMGRNGRRVTESRKAMARLMNYLDGDDAEIVIEWTDTLAESS